MRRFWIRCRAVVASIFPGMIACSAAPAQTPPVPPPVEQLTADCARPVYATDRFVCDDPQLRASDSALREKASRIDIDRSSPWIEGHVEWFRRRSLCAFQADQRTCVVGAYAERRAVLDALDHPQVGSIRSVPVRCTTPDIVAIAEGSQMTLFGVEGAVAGVAFAPARDSPWRNYVTATRKGRVIAIESTDAKKSKCRLAAARP